MEKRVINCPAGNFFGCLEEELNVFRDEKDGFQTAAPFVSFGLSLKGGKIEVSEASARTKKRRRKAMGRFVGIAHRVKKTANGEARPTMVCILTEARNKEYRLETETDELDFLLGRFPISWRKPADDENLTGFNPWQIKWRLIKKGESPESFSSHHLRKGGRNWFVAIKVPVEFDGIKAGDTVAMVMGGSGDRFAYAINNRGQKVGAKLLRLKPAILDERRGDRREKKNDHLLLAELVKSEPEIFQAIISRDAQLIRLREAYFRREEAMKARIACEQRLRTGLIGKVFLSEAGEYPEGSIEDLADAEKANDVILASLLKEERARENELKKILSGYDVYGLFDEVAGVGAMIAGRLIATIGDIRRFPTVAKFKAYCGLHTLFDPRGDGNFRKLAAGEIPTGDGLFVRRRGGEISDWKEEARQCFFLIGDQFNRRPDSEWGRRLLEYKAKFRAKHPDVMCKECGVVWSDDCRKKKHHRKYNDGHILRMATWRTVTKFAEWLYREWTALTDKADDSLAIKEKGEEVAA